LTTLGKLGAGSVALASFALFASAFLLEQRTAVAAVPLAPAASHGAVVAEAAAAVTVDYPLEGSIFPPDFAAPTFEWHDASAATRWRIEVTFADGSTPVITSAAGPRPNVGEIDPRCVSEVNEPPRLTPERKSAHTWKPDAIAWRAMKERSVAGPATVRIVGLAGEPATGAPGKAAGSTLSNAAPLSSGSVRIHTSKDPVGAPIFYRDVPLMPSAAEKGIIQPLARNKVQLIAWRLRDVSQPASRVLLTGMHTCANCHSFSRDGKTLGMDLDGPKNDKGVYALTDVQPVTTIKNENVVAWSSYRSKLGNQVRVGFMSQVSPDGRHVVTTILPRPGADGTRSDQPLSKQLLKPLYYVSNFKDYRFLQVFYPTGGILVWYDRATKELKPLPGADDPRYVQANSTWSPDGKYLVFVRAEARDPTPKDRPIAAFANDPNEVQMQYDLYRIPWNDGRGGAAEPVRGASQNGMSNSFPKVSPDGKWLVFVKAKNGLLMRPDGKLWIVPAEGGEARLMRCNTPLMNSWHSFSPNGRWLVFSSKSRSPYTQLFLTHVDEDGNDSPAILIENSTAANRAVNIPEFVNVPYSGFQKILTPAADFYQQFDVAADLTEKGRHPAAIVEWQKALALNEADDRAQNSYAVSLASAGRVSEALPHFERAIALNPEYADAYNSMGAALMSAGRLDEAMARFRKAIELEPDDAGIRTNLGVALAQAGRLDEAMPYLEKAVELDPQYAAARANLGGALLQRGDPASAVPHLEKAVELAPDRAVQLRSTLGLALLGANRADDAVAQFQEALAADPNAVPALEGLATAYHYVEGRTGDALAQWRKVLRLQPGYVPVLIQASWVLATTPDDALRNGAEAAVLADRAVRATGGKEAAALDALAAALAETGRFAEAAGTAERARAAARAQGNSGLAAEVDARLAAYRAHKPWREAR
jgi:tetratricopeptide (TPR) repeat protein